MAKVIKEITFFKGKDQDLSKEKLLEKIDRLKKE